MTLFYQVIVEYLPPYGLFICLIDLLECLHSVPQAQVCWLVDIFASSFWLVKRMYGTRSDMYVIALLPNKNRNAKKQAHCQTFPNTLSLWKQHIVV